MFINIIVALLIVNAPKAMSKFWLTATVEEIQWRDGCLSTALCSKPRLQLTEKLIPFGDRVEISWPTSERSIKSRQFVTFWPSGRFDDVTISAEIVGTDRTYNFPRICDQSQSIRIFNSRNDLDLLIENVDSSASIDKSIKTIEINTRCFKAKIRIEKHVEQCPWCNNPNDVLISNSEPLLEIKSDSALTQIQQLLNDESIILVLSIFAVFITSAFSILLIIHLKSKKANFDERIVDIQPKLIPFYGGFRIGSASYSTSSQNSDETRYNLPWDQKSSHLSIPNQFQVVTSQSSIKSEASSETSEGYHSFQTSSPV